MPSPQTKTTGTENSRCFLAMDPMLPLLCARAAVELDLVRQNKDTTLSSVEKLANLLPTLPTATETRKYSDYLDPSASVVIKKALLESEEVSSLRRMTFPTFSRYTLRIKERLQTARQLGNTKLEPLIKFCVALSDVSAAYQEAILAPEEQ